MFTLKIPVIESAPLFIRILGICTVAIGMMVLVGWAMDIAILRSVIHGAVEMKANTALGLTVSGLTLFILADQQSRRLQPIAGPMAILVALLGLSTLTEYLFGWQLGIDELLFRDTANAYNTIPGRMSPYTAMTFIAVGSTLAFLAWSKLRQLVQLLSVMVVVVGALSFIGYLWNASEIVTDAMVPPIAVNTAVGFLFLGLGTLVLNRIKINSAEKSLITHGAIEFKVIGSFVCTLLLLVFIGGDLYRSVTEFSSATKWVSHTQEVRAGLSDLYSTLSDAEAAQRNYLITSDPQYLKLLQSYGDTLSAQMQNVIYLVADNAPQLDNAKKLQSLISKRLSEMALLNTMLETKGLQAVRAEITSGAVSKIKFDIRAVSRQMNEGEAVLLTQRQNLVARGQKNTLIALLLMIISVSAIFVFLFYSILHEKKLRSERENELAQAKVIAENASQAKSAFLSSMSHELRTPLNAILGFGQILASEKLPSTPVQKKEFVSHILKAGRHLLTLINEILDLARVESGAMVLSLEPVGMADILLECQTMVEPIGAQRNIRLVFPTGCDLYVVADRTRLKQILLNLLSNAIKYNRELGSVMVNCDAISGERIHISIQDTGAGLRPDQVDALFQPFNRLGQETGPEEGTGIGLVVTKRLVELMSGTIGVSSTAGIGSVFWIDLPATSPPQPNTGNGSNQLGDKPVANTSEDRPPTLLYIEDNPANLRLVEELVRFRTDLRLISAAEGHLGIELASTHLPDLILMDINLPGMSGDDARKVLQTSPKTAHIPIIAVTANAMPRDIQKGIDAGFFRYITKPINIDEFTEAIDSALKLAVSRRNAVV